MSKLLKFKDSVSMEDAARYLSTLLGEEVTWDDVKYLVLEGHLTASIIAQGWACYIPSQHETTTVGGEVIVILEQRKGGIPDDYLWGAYPITPDSLEQNAGVTLLLDDGREARCYEVPDSWRDTPITHVKEPQSADRVSIVEAMKFSLDALRQLAESQPEAIPADALKAPHIGFDDLVFLPEHLLEFAAKANDTAPAKPIDYRERESMERIILALAKEAGIDLTEPYKAAAVVEAAAARHRVELPKSKDTIAGKLRAAARRDTYGRP
ncbi:hypothetical protein SAMN05216578_10920 [Halopseudomonas formosensis]|uniref:Uncharacterized protein n=1 Tax=Halopseudomonas formosensis TaxID=1002526 RepID=A0A1I6BZ30_9GAMM|nr:hypothetical protein [Halopseudomonas formosensis]SFQ86163.1 hypothetical protein SAMN05216578_10920 [Halopseudomonas formosensis]